ncbi:MAG: hypothetical protein ACI4V7_08500 [Succinivibrionaceae bacterium]
MKKYTPNLDACKIDLKKYVRPSNNKGVLTFAWIYTILAGICIGLLICNQFVNFLNKYQLLTEACAAFLLFLAGKCFFNFVKTNSKFLRWDIAAGKIEEIVEDEKDKKTFITLSFTTDDGCEFKAVESFTYPVIDKIKELNLGELPILYQPSRYSKGAYYIDLRFNNGILDTSYIHIKSE